jgi:CubicO group peptidase (beta-lactamase class C family)
MTSASIEGFVAPGLDLVAEEFSRNFRDRGELGAAFSVYRGSEALVDVWGGVADAGSGRTWKEDTLQVIFSGTKGLVAVCMLILLERGLLDLDSPVQRYWPEFAIEGKDRILVRDVVSHTTGLPTIGIPFEVDDVLDPVRMAEVLAARKPVPSAGGPRYHALTFGWLCDQLVRRVDGRSLGRFFADEVAAPLDLEVWIGLPPEEESRVARLELDDEWGTGRTARPPILERDSDGNLVEGDPPVFERETFPWNSDRFHAAEIAGAGGIGSARSVARLYACLAAGGTLDDVCLLNESTVRLGRTELSRGRDPVLDLPLAFGVGFELQTELQRLGPPRDAFGHTGAGGSVHGAWPSVGIGFSYAMNLMRDGDVPDERAAALLRVLDEVVR